MTYCLDTNIIVDVLRGNSPLLARKFDAVSPATVKVPTAVKAELLWGVELSNRPEEKRRDVEGFLNTFELLPFNDASTYFYARTKIALDRRGLPIGPMDLIIAATALAHGAVLVTNNVREFSRVPGLQIEDWTKP